MALAGMLLAPLCVVLLLVLGFASVSENALAQGALRGMGAVAAGLIAASGLRLIGALQHNPMGRPACIGFAALSFVGVGLLRIPLAWVLLGMGCVACAWAYRKLSQAQAAGGKP